MQPCFSFLNSRSTLAAFSVAVLGLWGQTTAHADVKYTTVVSMAMGGNFKPITTTTTWLKNGLERIDSKQEIGMFSMNETTITSAAKRNRITFDPKLKIYYVEGFGADGRPAPKPEPAMPGAPKGPAGTGKMVLTVSAKFLGREKMLNYQARHYTTNIAMETSGCCGTGGMKFKTEDWRADVTLPTPAYRPDPNENYRHLNRTSGSNCKITFQQKGDLAGYAAAQKGLTLKSIMFDAQSNKPITSTQITMLSFAALGSPDFAVPAGYKQVSAAEYEKQQQQAMMESMMGGMKNGGKGGMGLPFPIPGMDAPAPQESDEPAAPPAPEDEAPTTDAENAVKNKLKKKFKFPF